MKIARKFFAAASVLVVLAVHAATASAWTVPNKADDKGNRTITCKDGTQFTHNGTYQNALDSAVGLCKNHQGYVSISPVQIERSRAELPNRAALLESGPGDANGGGSSAHGTAARQGVRAGEGRGQ